MILPVTATKWKLISINPIKGRFPIITTLKNGVLPPFQNSESFNSPYLQMIKDINFSPIPSNFSFRADVDRRFVKTQLWGVDENNNLTINGIEPNYEKLFTFTRVYNLRWNLSRGLSLDYSARALAIVDEPEGELDTSEKRDQVKDNLLDLGRLKNFDQTLALNYRLPLDKNSFYRLDKCRPWLSHQLLMGGWSL